MSDSPNREILLYVTPLRTHFPILHLLTKAQNLMKTTGKIQKFPLILLEDLNNAWYYYHTHTTEIAHQIAENELA
jgi:hypothetical protein